MRKSTHTCRILCCIISLSHVVSASVQPLTHIHPHTHTHWEIPSSSEESIGVAWKERGRAAGEKSSRSDFHPEMVHWCPTALWSPGGNNIQLTFHWRNLIPLFPLPAIPYCRASMHAHARLDVNHAHMHVHNWKNMAMVDSHPSYTLWPPILSPLIHVIYVPYVLLRIWLIRRQNMNIPCYKCWETTHLSIAACGKRKKGGNSTPKKRMEFQNV